MAVSKKINEEYFQSGDTYTIKTAYIAGLTNGAGNKFDGTVFLPKRIPIGMSVAASGKWNNVRKYDGTLLTINADTVNCSINGDNTVALSGTGSGLGFSVVVNIVPTSITLTFT